MAEGIVTRLGYSVDILSDGAEALGTILDTSSVAVLMNCHMPGMDGFGHPPGAGH